MKVAIDGGSDKGHAVRGIGVHTREIAKELQKISKKEKSFEVKIIDFESEDLSRFDIVHYPDFNPYILSLPKEKPAKNVVLTIHDLIMLLYPKQYPPGLRGKIKFMKQRKRLRYVDKIITISETSKKDICRFLKVSPDKVDVVYLAPQTGIKKVKNKKKLEDVRKKYGLPEKYVLYVGDVNYNKNIPNLLEACTKAGLDLVMIGKHAKEVQDGNFNMKTDKGPKDYLRSILGLEHPQQKHLFKLKKQFKGKHVHVLGYLPGKDFSSVFSAATVYCMPSLYEGFGLPVLEAMSFDIRVVASKTQALVEVAGPAALYFDPEDPDDMANIIKAVVNDTDIQKDLIKEGNERLKQFSWQQAAKETYKVYKSLFNEKK